MAISRGAGPYITLIARARFPWSEDPVHNTPSLMGGDLKVSRVRHLLTYRLPAEYLPASGWGHLTVDYITINLRCCFGLASSGI